MSEGDSDRESVITALKIAETALKEARGRSDRISGVEQARISNAEKKVWQARITVESTAGYDTDKDQ